MTEKFQLTDNFENGFIEEEQEEINKPNSEDDDLQEFDEIALRTFELMTSPSMYKKIMETRQDGKSTYLERQLQSALYKKKVFSENINDVFQTMLEDTTAVSGTNNMFSSEVRMAFETFVSKTIEMIEKDQWMKDISAEEPFMTFGVAKNTGEFRYGIDDDCRSPKPYIHDHAQRGITFNSSHQLRSATSSHQLHTHKLCNKDTFNPIQDRFL